MTKALFRLPKCTGWSALLLVENPEDRFSRTEAHIVNLDDFTGEIMIGELLNGIL